MKTKQMKNMGLTLALAVSTTLFASAQGFNVGVNVGYGLGAGNSVIGVNETATTRENVKGSFGQGLNFGLNLNYMFSENVGADLGFGMLMGNEFTITDNSTSGSTGDMKIKGSMIRIMPGIKVSAGDDKSMSPYGRFGLVVGVAGKLKEKDTYTGSGFSGTYEYEYSGGSSFGWYGAFGIGFELSDKIKLNTELITINQTYGPEKAENTARSDGQALDPTRTLSDDDAASNPNTGLKQYVPFGSIGLNVGIQIGF
ncbi:MAG TPA: porin family protein [Bacteroidia bacterium]|nr:porin family protein [Bacteroidia bacterium]